MTLLSDAHINLEIKISGQLYIGFCFYFSCVCLVAQSRPALCDPINCNPPGSSIHVDSSEKNTGVGCHALFPGIFSTQGSNQGLLHCRQILYQLNYQGSPVYQCGCVKISKQIKHTLISERRNQSKSGQDTVFSHL